MENNFNPFHKDLQNLEPNDLLQLKTVHEGWYVDYKVAALNSRGYAKAISAMANTYGGWVFIGIREESRDNNVAGDFIGVANDEVDLVCQNIRQSATEHLNPTPFFELRAICCPGNEDSRKVICINIPVSPRAPIVHTDGRIYRRVNDSSEPVPENNREAIAHLLQRVNRVEKSHRNWFKKGPELSKLEKGVSYLRVMATPDYWGEKEIWIEESAEAFTELINSQTDGPTFSIPYNHISTHLGGFVFRSVNSQDLRSFSGTLVIWRNLRSEFWMPLPSFQVDQYETYNRKNEELRKLAKYLNDRGHGDSIALDLTMAFAALDGYLSLLRKIQKHKGLTGETYLKFQLGNTWRRIPVLSTLPEKIGWIKYGIPVILSDKVSSSSSGAEWSYNKIDLNENETTEFKSIFLGVSLYVQILTAVGLGMGSEEGFTETVSDAIRKAFELANKVQ